jgi:hypothetical protein
LASVSHNLLFLPQLSEGNLSALSNNSKEYFSMNYTFHFLSGSYLGASCLANFCL